MLGRRVSMDAQTALDLFSKEMMAYDSHVGQSDEFYYNLPYIRNYELTTSIPIAPVSGNVIKFYQYRLDKPVRIFTDVYDTTAKSNDDALSDEEQELSEGLDGDDEMYERDESELSEEEMAALLTADNGEESADADGDDAYDKPPSGGVADEYDDEAYDKQPSVVPSDGGEQDWEPDQF